MKRAAVIAVVARWACALAAAGYALVTLLAFVPVFPCSMLEHFRVQYLLAGIPVVAACAWTRGFDAALIALLVNLAIVAPDLGAAATPKQGTPVAATASAALTAPSATRGERGMSGPYRVVRPVERCVRSAHLVDDRGARYIKDMPNIQELDTRLNDAILSGKALEAFDELYADDVVMQENTDPPYVGKPYNRQREIEFFASVEQFHDGRVLASATSGDVSFSEWEMDVTLKGVGRIKMNQVAVRRWKTGKVIHERFYHK